MIPQGPTCLLPTCGFCLWPIPRPPETLQSPNWCSPPHKASQGGQRTGRPAGCPSPCGRCPGVPVGCCGRHELLSPPPVDPHDHLTPRWGCANFQMQPDALWARMWIFFFFKNVDLEESFMVFTLQKCYVPMAALRFVPGRR